jgi:hypothetical protein
MLHSALDFKLTIITILSLVKNFFKGAQKIELENYTV